MKILVVVPSYCPSTGGGVATCIKTLCEAWAHIGMDVTVFTTSSGIDGSPSSETVIETGGVKVHYFPSTFSHFPLFDSRTLTEKLRKTVRNYHMVYASAIWQWIGIDTARICHIKKVPMVIGLHGSFARLLRKKGYLKKTVLYNAFLRQVLKRASAIHLTSEEERIEAKDWLNGVATFKVANAVSPESWRKVSSGKAFRERYGIPSQACVVTCVGRPDWKKRIDMLIRAIAERPEWYLVVAGDDESGMAPKWKKLAADLNVSERVAWTGFLDKNEMAEAYAASNISALISVDENFGMVVVESLLCGVPVVVTPKVGVWEMIRNDQVGKVVSLNVDSVSKVLDDYVRHPDQWESMGKRARSVAILRFSPDRIASEMALAFKAIISGVGRSCEFRKKSEYVLSP